MAQSNLFSFTSSLCTIQLHGLLSSFPLTCRTGSLLSFLYNLCSPSLKLILPLSDLEPWFSPGFVVSLLLLLYLENVILSHSFERHFCEHNPEIYFFSLDLSPDLKSHISNILLGITRSVSQTGYNCPPLSKVDLLRASLHLMALPYSQPLKPSNLSDLTASCPVLRSHCLFSFSISTPTVPVQTFLSLTWTSASNYFSLWSG